MIAGGGKDVMSEAMKRWGEAVEMGEGGEWWRKRIGVHGISSHPPKAKLSKQQSTISECKKWQ